MNNDACFILLVQKAESDFEQLTVCRKRRHPTKHIILNLVWLAFDFIHKYCVFSLASSNSKFQVFSLTLQRIKHRTSGFEWEHNNTNPRRQLLLTFLKKYIFTDQTYQTNVHEIILPYGTSFSLMLVCLSPICTCSMFLQSMMLREVWMEVFSNGVSIQHSKAVQDVGTEHTTPLPDISGTLTSLTHSINHKNK